MSLLLSGPVASADSLACIKPEIERAKRGSIVSEKDLSFLVVTLQAYSAEPESAHAALYESCDELAPIKESETAERAQTLVAGPFIGYFDMVTSPVKGLVLADLRSTFVRGNETSLLRQYTEELDALSMRYADPIRRLRATMEHSMSRQGNYDHKKQEIRAGDFLTRLSAGVPFYFTSPQEVLQNVQSNGFGGVCEEFSTLLSWSIKRTSKYTYATRRAFGNFHVWNRVFYKQHVFDLDPTFYNTNKLFIPLYPRQLSGLPEQKRQPLYATCKRVQSCVRNST